MKTTAPRWRRPAFVASALVALGLHAHAAPPSTPPSRPDPLNADAPVPPASYPSALSRYQKRTDTEVGSWRQANDLTAKIGGWRTYAREAQQSEGDTDKAQPPQAPSSAPSAPLAPSAPAAPAAPAAPQPHPHHQHGGQP